MNAPSKSVGTGATFATMLVIALAAWAMGAPELGIALTVGAFGALGVTLASRLSLRATHRRLTPEPRI